jgi:hypothetical protein
MILSRTSQGALGGEGRYDDEGAVDDKAGGNAAGVNESEAGDTVIGEGLNLEKGRGY